MIALGRMAARVFSVSTRDSPFETLEACAVMEMASAPRQFGGDLKAGAGARGRLEEQVHHHAPAQQIQFAETTLVAGLEVARTVQDGLDLLARQTLDAQQAPGFFAGDRYGGQTYQTSTIRASSA